MIILYNRLFILWNAVISYQTLHHQFNLRSFICAEDIGITTKSLVDAFSFIKLDDSNDPIETKGKLTLNVSAWAIFLVNIHVIYLGILQEVKCYFQKEIYPSPQSWNPYLRTWFSCKVT